MNINKTLYIKAEDVEAWEDAAKYLRFYRNLSLSAYLTQHVKELVIELREIDRRHHQTKQAPNVPK